MTPREPHQTPSRPLDRACRRYGAALVTLRRRAEFLRVRGGTRWSSPAFLIEGKARQPTGDLGCACDVQPRFGFTITKKIGKAHERNRMRRRLSHALRLCDVPPALASWDFVIVARPPALTHPFDALVRDFQNALARLERGSAGGAGSPAQRPPAARQDRRTTK